MTQHILQGQVLSRSQFQHHFAFSLNYRSRGIAHIQLFSTTNLMDYGPFGGGILVLCGLSADPTFQHPQNQRHRQHHLDIAIPPTQKPEQRTQRSKFAFNCLNAADPSFQPPLNQHHLDIAIPPTLTPNYRTQRDKKENKCRVRAGTAYARNSAIGDSFCKSKYESGMPENEGRCSAIANCLARRPSFPLPTHSNIASSKVTPQPTLPNSGSMSGAPRLVRSRAVRRDIVQDWNFDEVVMGR
ncbi:hypothetical protein Prudu_021451 [Prunus dulcis]|uniref:Uncharacterized protein n=1 Tax=Prunus dulcis TaxID=3755 RepID=A0A4Y1RYJ2_PRUDU|nr:hypothetical protein Prudu_021451 [Prunus dulcis]